RGRSFPARRRKTQQLQRYFTAERAVLNAPLRARMQDIGGGVSGLVPANAESIEDQLGLTAKDMSDMGRLAHLAMNPREDASREEIYLAIASLYRVQGTNLNNRERELMREILRRL